MNKSSYIEELSYECLEAKKLCIRLGYKVALDDLNFKVNNGEVFACLIKQSHFLLQERLKNNSASAADPL